MVVYLHHEMPEGAALHAFAMLAECWCKIIFGDRFRGFRKEQRTCHDHLHWHVNLRDER